MLFYKLVVFLPINSITPYLYSRSGNKFVTQVSFSPAENSSKQPRSNEIESKLPTNNKIPLSHLPETFLTNRRLGIEAKKEDFDALIQYVKSIALFRA
ncbi:hypothetical protein AVEN_66434-1 [Araneus ventricosus]|uniref:Uncharacterized protein n=1 Tax=Araneus ventricosus TaxID=182803 RepID=A0A4Y2P9M8_ARAVE|nr:hypothetical protein AVEN_66434-1 [Araneus ventricosus]